MKAKVLKRNLLFPFLTILKNVFRERESRTRQGKKLFVQFGISRYFLTLAQFVCFFRGGFVRGYYTYYRVSNMAPNEGKKRMR